MKNNPESDAFREYLENQVRKFEQNLGDYRNPHLSINDFCNLFCLDCEQRFECEEYEADDWEGFYT